MWAKDEDAKRYSELAKAWRRNLPPQWLEADEKELAWFSTVGWMVYDFMLRLECVKENGQIDLPEDGYCHTPAGYIRWCVLEPGLRILGWNEGGVSWVTILESLIDNHVIYEGLTIPATAPKLASSFGGAAKAVITAIGELLRSFEFSGDPVRGGAALSHTLTAIAQLLAYAEVVQWSNLWREANRDPAA